MVSGEGGACGWPPRRRPAPARARSTALALALLLAGLGLAPRPAAAAGCRRVVALAPSATELLFALGLGARAVGVADASVWPPAVRSLPRLGGLFDPHLEQILGLHPDLALLVPSQAELGRSLERLGVATLVLPSESLVDVASAAHQLGARCDAPAAAARFVADWQRRLAPHPLESHPSVLLVVGRPAGTLRGMVAAGPGTFYDELLARLGARNVLADTVVSYPQVALEEVLARRPDVILDLQPKALAPAERRRLLDDWRALPGRAGAVLAARVRVLGADYALIPGPRLPRLYDDLRAALAP